MPKQKRKKVGKGYGRQRGLEKLLDVVARLRDKKTGCPWDREQTLKTLKQYCIEESYEVLDAIDSGDAEKHKEELGDLLLQIALHAQIRSEAGLFDFNDIAETLSKKLIRRHPHVFGDVDAKDSNTVLRNWEAIKAAEKKDKNDKDKSVLEGVPRFMPALQKAQRIQSRVAKFGFDWTHVRDVWKKYDEELGELKKAIKSRKQDHIEEEVGDLIFVLVNLCRFLNVHAEEALELCNRKFVRRFQEIEKRVHAEGKSLSQCTLAELDTHWNEVKKKHA